MSQNEGFLVPHVTQPLNFTVEIPGSKSITNRALLMAALCDQTVQLNRVLLSDDSKHFMDCLIKLGFGVEINEDQKIVVIHGRGGEIPNRKTNLYVGSAGTAARFITAMLALTQGQYLVEASPQMTARPMKPLLDSLVTLGTEFEYLQKPYCLPFHIKSNGLPGGKVTIQASQSSQFLSAILLVGCYSRNDLEISLDGPLAAKPYVEITLRMMSEFGVRVENNEFQKFIIPHGQRYRGAKYDIEPDVSNAAYFLAMAVLTGGSALIKGIKLNSLQGDIQFINILKQLGAVIETMNEGIYIQGPENGSFSGIDVDMGSMPDQTMTLAALAPFASSPTNIRNIGLIKFHESNRIQAIINELTRIGIRCEETGSGIKIYPGNPHAAEIETYDDHRMAMAFSLIGLRVPGIRIKNPSCTGKTFANYFDCFQQAIAARD